MLDASKTVSFDSGKNAEAEIKNHRRERGRAPGKIKSVPEKNPLPCRRTSGKPENLTINKVN